MTENLTAPNRLSGSDQLDDNLVNPAGSRRHLDKCQLRTIMAGYDDNRDTLAEFLEISPSTLSYKMNERKNSTFSLSEVRKMIDRYKLSNDQILDVFFNTSLQK